MTRAGEEIGFRGPTVMKAAGITYRQLDYWARTGLVVPSVRDAGGSGTQRMYSFRDIVRCRIINKLLDAGISLPKIRKALEYVERELGRPLEEVTLMSDGKSIYTPTSPGEIVDLVRGGQGVFAIAVDKVYEELQGTIAELRTSTEGEAGEGSTEVSSG